jgi:putative tryptophan/tyrosine transport system substrate-binding protein
VNPLHLPAVAAELVALKVDIILAVATPAARAAQQATSAIPIVAPNMGDQLPRTTVSRPFQLFVIRPLTTSAA